MTSFPIGRGFISRLLDNIDDDNFIDFDGDTIPLDPPSPKSLIAETIDRFRAQIETLDGRDMRLTKVIDDSTEERRQVRACREAVKLAMDALDKPDEDRAEVTLVKQDWTDND